jgi:alkanesulfonate monooxygenase SsuD/methylene tetrahydromethanopterin reductase-like flavin-dependent oxidoreductase (luciferase family)
VVRSLGLFSLVGESEADLRARFERLQRDTPAGVLDGIGLDQWRQGRLVGTVAQVGEQVESWASLGVDQLIVGLGAVPFAASRLDDLALVARAVRLDK